MIFLSQPGQIWSDQRDNSQLVVWATIKRKWAATEVQEGARQLATCLVEIKIDMMKKGGNGILNRPLTLLCKRSVCIRAKLVTRTHHLVGPIKKVPLYAPIGYYVVSPTNDLQNVS